MMVSVGLQLLNLGLFCLVRSQNLAIKSPENMKTSSAEKKYARFCVSRKILEQDQTWDFYAHRQLTKDKADLRNCHTFSWAKHKLPRKVRFLTHLNCATSSKLHFNAVLQRSVSRRPTGRMAVEICVNDSIKRFLKGQVNFH